MKTRFLQAILCDQDAIQGRQMGALIRDLFNKMTYEQTSDAIATECKENKPRVIFFNINIEQRIASFEILAKLPLEADSQTIIFGYTDTHEPALIAHAIELGFHDIFVKPFDVDIVATKINKFFEFEKTQNRQINYQSLKPSLKCSLQLSVKLMSLDENGLNCMSENYISKGTVLKLDSKTINQIFEETPVEFMVSKTWMGDNVGEYYLYAEPKAASEKSSALLRKFIIRSL